MAHAEQIGFVENLATIFSQRASAQTVFGQPVERKGITIIPVAKVRYGLGGGKGVRTPEKLARLEKSGKNGEKGEGGGGGIEIKPLGFIEIKEGESKFKRFSNSGMILQMAAGVALSAWIIMHGIKEFSRNPSTS